MPQEAVYIPIHYANFDDDKPIAVVCPACDGRVLTRVEAKQGVRAWIASLGKTLQNFRNYFVPLKNKYVAIFKELYFAHTIPFDNGTQFNKFSFYFLKF